MNEVVDECPPRFLTQPPGSSLALLRSAPDEVWALVDRLLSEYSPRAIVHLAAESHVDRSLVGPGDFLAANINGTFDLEVYWQVDRDHNGSD
jgi:nucleoside-diphosphate-sugar epimerase